MEDKEKESINVRVCKEWFPKGSRPNQTDDGFLMNRLLKEQIDILVKNIRKDWDFTIIISGSGMVRIGKSVLAMQIGAYWTDQIRKKYGVNVPFDVNNNFVFNGEELIAKGNELGEKYPYSCLIYDEAGADLLGRKVMTSVTQQVLDYFRECGQYNMLNILVLPDFFDLPKGIAVTRSIALINVYHSSDKEGNFKRGYFNFYSRRNKKQLYLKGKKELNYYAAPYDFNGKFSNFYTVDEQEYRQRKLEVLKSRGHNPKKDKYKIILAGLIYYLKHKGIELDNGMLLKFTYNEISEMIKEITGIKFEDKRIFDFLVNYLPNLMKNR